jgi:hypothetical protein
MANQNALIAMFVLSNLPSLLIGMLLAWSVLTSLVFGALVKAGIILMLYVLGGGAHGGVEEKVISASMAITMGAFIGAAGYLCKFTYHNADTIKNTLGGLLILPLAALPTVGYVYALWHDAQQGSMAYFLADLIIVPWGVIRGLLLLLGVI